MKLHQTIICIVIMLTFTYCQPAGQPVEQQTKSPQGELITSIRSVLAQAPDSSLKLSRHYLKENPFPNDSMFYYDLKHIEGESLFNLGKIQASLPYFHQNLIFWEKEKEKPKDDEKKMLYAKKKYAMVLYSLGYAYTELNDYEHAINYLNQSEEYSQAAQFSKILISIYFEKENLFRQKGDYTGALKNIDQCIYLCNQTQDSASMISALQAYADLYSNCFYFEEAEKQFSEILKYKNHFTPFSRYCYHNGKGRMYYLWKKYPEAKSEFKKALDYISESKLIQYLVLINNLAESSLLAGELDDAKYYLDILTGYDNIIKQVPLFNYNYYSLSAGYNTQTNNLAIAGRQIKKADQIGANNTIDNIIYMLHLERKIAYLKATGKFEEAFQLLEEYNHLNLETGLKNDRIQVSGLKYRFSRDTTIINQENLISQNRLELKTYRYRQYFLIGLMILLAVSATLIVLFVRKTKQLLYIKGKQEITALRVQNSRNAMSPHFFLNVLALLNGATGQPETLKEKIRSLSILLRKVIENIDEIAVPLERELEAVKAYIDLQKGFVPEPFVVDYQTESINLQQNIPAMVMQIPVENAIKHGLLPLEGEKCLSIKIQSQADKLNIQIEDNGIGLSAAQGRSTGTGTGLKTLQQIIYMLNSKNKQQITLAINEKDTNKGQTKGTLVDIVIPENYNYTL